jgi:hypothetical protein
MFALNLRGFGDLRRARRILIYRRMSIAHHFFVAKLNILPYKTAPYFNVTRNR